MRIASTRDGKIIEQFTTIREAGRAGYTISLIHRCLSGEAKTHKGFGWRRVDGIHGLDLWVAARLQPNSLSQIGWSTILKAFTASLPVAEADIHYDRFKVALMEQFPGLGNQPGSIHVLDGYELLPPGANA